MLKAICLKDVLPGDVVFHTPGECYKVADVSRLFGPEVPDHLESIALFIVGNPCFQISGPANEVIGLLHRPWLEGKTEAQMQEDILELAGRLLNCPESEKDETARQLRETIEAYELGKPPESDK